MNRFATLLLASIFVIAGVLTTPLSAQADELPDSNIATVLQTPDTSHINVRTGPGTEHTLSYTIPAGTDVKIGCWTDGSAVNGQYGTSKIWYKTTSGGTTGWVSDAVLYTGTNDPVTVRCQEAKSPTTTEEPVKVEGLFLPNDGRIVWDSLLNHYYAIKNAGKAVVIDWTFFSENATFVDFAYTLPIDEANHPNHTSFSFDESENWDMYLSLRTFDVKRTSENCFMISDTYDFGWDYPTYMVDGWTGAAKPFPIHSSGCLTRP